MRFVRKRTTIPVPFIVDYLVSDDNESYLIMELILGETLADQYGSLTEDVCRIIIRDLIDITNELRSIPPPSRPPLVCGLGSIPIDCRRIQLNGSSSFGPFDSVKAFHEELIKFSNLEFPNQETESAALSKIHRLYEKPYRIVFTHNDLHPGNVIVDANFRIVGIIDWESSGWMPEYWLAFEMCERNKIHVTDSKMKWEFEATDVTINSSKFTAEKGPCWSHRYLLKLNEGSRRRRRYRTKVYL
ncbi:hypothetical protein HHX47_DHR10000188 [Lentinula edodes]|nr:hypothetical protein HHX47_DHR10000188 [Lentinula edodes]